MIFLPWASKVAGSGRVLQDAGALTRSLLLMCPIDGNLLVAYIHFRLNSYTRSDISRPIIIIQTTSWTSSPVSLCGRLLDYSVIHSFIIPLHGICCCTWIKKQVDSFWLCYYNDAQHLEIKLSSFCYSDFDLIDPATDIIDPCVRYLRSNGDYQWQTRGNCSQRIDTSLSALLGCHNRTWLWLGHCNFQAK